MGKAKINKENLEDLLSKILENTEEERDLALERYRRQDDMMESSDDFVIQGKNAVDFLKVASDRSNSLFNIAKLMKDVIYNDNSNSQSSGSNMDDAMKKRIQEMVNETKKDD